MRQLLPPATVCFLLWICFCEFFLAPDRASRTVRDPGKRTVVFAIEQRRCVQVYFGVALLVESNTSGNVDFRMCQFRLRNLAPLHQAGGGKTVVWFNDVGFEVAITCLSIFALLHERCCGIAISGFSVRIDSNGFLIPGFGLRKIAPLDINVAGEKCSMVQGGVKLQGFRVECKGAVELAL